MKTAKIFATTITTMLTSVTAFGAIITKDTQPPAITSFTVPALVNTMSIPVTSFTASDNTGVSGYLITQSPVKPLATTVGWKATRPGYYTVTSPGPKVLYAWAKDAKGNVSPSKAAAVTVDIAPPVVGAFSLPATSASMSIPVSSFDAGDNLRVTGYMITESVTRPSPNAPGWSSAPLSVYTTSTTGRKTLYAWARDGAGNVSSPKSATCAVDTASPTFTIAQTLSDQAQNTTLAFSALAMITGNLGAQSFFPPGKLADYTGFQYLRDNDPDNMGHNTSFLTRVAENVIYLLDDAQFAQLRDLAVSQLVRIDDYGYGRYPLMAAFRRLFDGSVPSGTTGLSLDAIKASSRGLYLIDGRISYDRAVLYARIFSSFTDSQKTYLAAMKGKGWKSWPDTSADPIKSLVDARMKILPQGTAVAVMTYASDLYSWYNGSLDADVYFCPERHGTYFGSFFIKDAPAIGHEGYGINEQLTATAGRALCDSSAGYVTASQAATISSLVDLQRNNLYASTVPYAHGALSIVSIRTQIATLLRSLIATGGVDSGDAVLNQVLDLSGAYGELDGENNYNYATVSAQVFKTLTDNQKSQLLALRKSIMSGAYNDGTPFDFSTVADYYLFSMKIPEASATAAIGNTDGFFK